MPAWSTDTQLKFRPKSVPAGPENARHALVETARDAVCELAGELNQILDPVIETLERSKWGIVERVVARKPARPTG